MSLRPVQPSSISKPCSLDSRSYPSSLNLPATIIYATSTAVRLYRQIPVSDNHKYFVLCRYRSGLTMVVLTLLVGSSAPARAASRPRECGPSVCERDGEAIVR